MRLAMLLLAASALPAQDLMPLPAKMTPGQGRLKIDESFRASCGGVRDTRLTDACDGIGRLLSAKTGIPMPAAGQGAATLEVRVAGPGEAVQSVREDESYRLSVTPQAARIDAATTVGALRGLATFAQLVSLGAEGYYAPAVEIDDSPRFPWRGLLLDVARHWMPMDVVKRTLDGMAAVKLNVFHIHLSDDQGFRIESRRYPKLHGMASDGNYFTQEQIREIVAYARGRGIRVIPEFDMPGHTQSWFVGYPELAAAPGPYQINRGIGVMDASMDPTREEVYTFLDGFIGEMAALFPDEYFHVGGDEVNGKQWNANTAIQEFKRARGFKTNEDLQSYFTKRVQAIVQKHGKKTVGWEEILHPDSPRDIVVHSWRGQKSLARAASQGFATILSWGYYLDLMEPASQHYLVDPITNETAGLTPEQKSRILGGEACEWAELITAENVDARIWPRTAAIAERLWSPQSVRDIGSMYRRMAAAGRHLEWVGLEHAESFRTMTERLAGAHSAEPVRVLAGVVEPVKGYKRHNSRKYTSFTPLNRLVDVARPESLEARDFGKLVDAYLASKTGREEIRRRLAVWRANDARLAPVIAGSALLAEAASLSADLSALAAAALEAMDYRDAGRHAPAKWSAAQYNLLLRAAAPKAELILSVVAPVRKLIEAAR